MQKLKKTEMGRKHTIPYGVYVAHGFISPHLAAQTGFNKDDLDIFWKALLICLNTIVQPRVV